MSEQTVREVGTFDQSGQPVTLAIETTDYGARVRLPACDTLTMSDAELEELALAIDRLRSERMRMGL